MTISASLGIEGEVKGTLKEEKCVNALQKLWREKVISAEGKKELFKGICASRIMYETEAWMVNSCERRNLEFF